MRTTITPLVDCNELKAFYCGLPDMDSFIQSSLVDSVQNHYCTAYALRDLDNDGFIVAVFALNFSSLSLDTDDKDDLILGVNGLVPTVTPSYTENFWAKSRYPALEISYLAVRSDYQHLRVGEFVIQEIADMAKQQSFAGCQFLVVEALKTPDYSTVGFYNKCNFIPNELPNPTKDTIRMFRPLWT